MAATDPDHLKGMLKSHGLLVHDYTNGSDHFKVITNADIIQKGLGNGLTCAYNMQNDKISIMNSLRFANNEVNPIQVGVNDGNYIMMGGYKT